MTNKVRIAEANGCKDGKSRCEFTQQAIDSLVSKLESVGVEDILAVGSKVISSVNIILLTCHVSKEWEKLPSAS